MLALLFPTQVPLRCPARRGVQRLTPPGPPLSPQLPGQQAPSRVQLGAVAQWAGALHNRMQLRKEDGLVTTCFHSSRCWEPEEQAGAET